MRIGTLRGRDALLAPPPAALVGGLATLALAAWALQLSGAATLGLAGAVGVLAGWTTMMVAMMLPSAAPLLLGLRRAEHHGAGSRLVLAAVGGYLAVWAATGLLVLAADAAMAAPAPWVAAALLTAGAYQITPLKRACLRRCRHPLGLLLRRRPGRRGAAGLGLRHGAHCVGCCWALMVVLVVAGAMGLPWAALVAVAVAAEKLLPAGPRVATALGLALLAAGIAVALEPSLADALRLDGQDGMAM